MASLGYIFAMIVIASSINAQTTIPSPNSANFNCSGVGGGNTNGNGNGITYANGTFGCNDTAQVTIDPRGCTASATAAVSAAATAVATAIAAANAVNIATAAANAAANAASVSTATCSVTCGAPQSVGTTTQQPPIISSASCMFALASNPSTGQTSNYCTTPNVCPTGYSCQYSVLNGNYICCQTCPNTSQIRALATNPANGQTSTNCLSPYVCGSGAQCLYAASIPTYICCATTYYG